MALRKVTNTRKIKKTDETNKRKTSRVSTKHNKSNTDTFVLKDITKASIKFLARRAGVKRIDRNVYLKVYEYIETIVSEVLSKTIVFAKYDKKKTLQPDHLERVLRLLNNPVALSCANNIKLDKHVTRKNKKTDNDQKKRHFKQGTVVLREIKFEQKRSDCTVFRRLPFKRLIRRRASDMRISNTVFLVLQIYTEFMVVKFLSNSNLCALHAGRISIQPSDLDLARTILSTA